MSKLASPEQRIVLGRRLALARESTGLTQSEFATSLGLNLRAYGNYERGEREAPLALLQALHAVHDFDPVWLLAGPGDTPLRSATRVVNVALVERITRTIDASLAAVGKRLKPASRLRLIEVAYAHCAQIGELDDQVIEKLMAVAA